MTCIVAGFFSAIDGERIDLGEGLSFSSLRIFLFVWGDADIGVGAVLVGSLQSLKFGDLLLNSLDSFSRLNNTMGTARNFSGLT